MDVHADVIALGHPGEPGALGEPRRVEIQDHPRDGLKDEVGDAKMWNVVRNHVDEIRVALSGEHVAECHDLKVDGKEERRDEWENVLLYVVRVEILASFCIFLSSLYEKKKNNKLFT